MKDVAVVEERRLPSILSFLLLGWELPTAKLHAPYRRRRDKREGGRLFFTWSGFVDKT